MVSLWTTRRVPGGMAAVFIDPIRAESDFHADARLSANGVLVARPGCTRTGGDSLQNARLAMASETQAGHSCLRIGSTGIRYCTPQYPIPRPAPAARSRETNAKGVVAFMSNWAGDYGLSRVTR